uniref:Uncharacterized protein n=1 Tax=Arundo donax TaxID=35708 RepID=A0A0A9AYX1_ARUDO
MASPLGVILTCAAVACRFLDLESSMCLTACRLSSQ